MEWLIIAIIGGVLIARSSVGRGLSMSSGGFAANTSHGAQPNTSGQPQYADGGAAPKTYRDTSQSGAGGGTNAGGGGQGSGFGNIFQGLAQLFGGGGSSPSETTTTTSDSSSWGLGGDMSIGAGGVSADVGAAASGPTDLGTQLAQQAQGLSSFGDASMGPTDLGLGIAGLSGDNLPGDGSSGGASDLGSAYSGGADSGSGDVPV